MTVDPAERFLEQALVVRRLPPGLLGREDPFHLATRPPGPLISSAVSIATRNR